MDSQNLDDLVNLIALNSEMDSEQIRNCILSELENIDDSFYNDFLSGMTAKIINGSNIVITSVEDVVQLSKAIISEKKIPSHAEVNRRKEEQINQRQSEAEKYREIVERFEKTQEQNAQQAQKAPEVVYKEDGEINYIDTINNYKELLDKVYTPPAEIVEKATQAVEKIIADDTSILDEAEKEDIIKRTAEGLAIDEAKGEMTRNGMSEGEALRIIGTSNLIKNLTNYFFVLEEKEDGRIAIVREMLEKLYLRDGKTTRDLEQYILEAKKEFKAGRTNGRVGNEADIQTTKGLVEDYEAGKTIEEIVDTQIYYDSNKVEFAKKVTEYEKVEEEISNNPDMTEEQKAAAIKAERDKFLVRYKSNISLLQTQYKGIVKDLTKELDSCQDEAERQLLESKIKRYSGRDERLDDIKPTHRISMLFDLERKINQRIEELKISLENETDEGKRKQIQNSIDAMYKDNLNLKGDVKFEALYGKRIDEMLQKKLEADTRANIVEIEKTEQKIEEAKRKAEELESNPQATDEEKQANEKEQKKLELLMEVLHKKQERYDTGDIYEAYNEGDIFQARRSFKKNLIKNAMQSSKEQMSDVVKRLKKMDPNSKEYIEESKKIERIKREFKVALIECGEPLDSTKEIIDSYSFVDGNQILDVLYVKALNKTRSISNTGILIEEQGRTANKESVETILEDKKFAKYVLEKEQELASSGMNVEDIKKLNIRLFEALGKASKGYKIKDTKFNIEDIEGTEEQKELISSFLNGYLENEPDFGKRESIVKRLAYSENHFAMKKYVDFGVERKINDKNRAQIRSEEIDDYFDGSRENLLVSEIIRTGDSDAIRDNFASSSVTLNTSELEKKTDELLAARRKEAKPQKQNMSILKRLTTKVKESDAMRAFNQVKAKLTIKTAEGQKTAQEESEQEEGEK